MMAVHRGEQGTTVLRIYIDEAGMVADAAFPPRKFDLMVLIFVVAIALEISS